MHDYFGAEWAADSGGDQRSGNDDAIYNDSQNPEEFQKLASLLFSCHFNCAYIYMILNYVRYRQNLLFLLFDTWARRRKFHPTVV